MRLEKRNSSLVQEYSVTNIKDLGRERMEERRSEAKGLSSELEW